jgi:hypothetical protein
MGVSVLAFAIAGATNIMALGGFLEKVRQAVEKLGVIV